MNKRNRVATAVMAVGVALMLGEGLVGAAQAQPYGYNGVGQYSYDDACRRQRTNRTIVGSLVGAAAGAALGFNMGARGHRNDGAWTGAAVGGLGGGLVGNRTGSCAAGLSAPPPNAPPAPPPRAYNDTYGPAYDDRGYARGYGPGSYGRPYEETVVVESAPPARSDSCTLAESPIYLPDGRVQKRFVRVCQDASGRYQVVD